MRLETGNLLLRAGLVLPAAATADELLQDETAFEDAGDRQRKALAESEAIQLWAVSHALVDMQGTIEPAEAAPCVPPWWSKKDLMRPEVRQWVRFFREEGALNLRRWLQQAAPYRADLCRILRGEGVPSQLWVLALLESGLDLHAESRSRAVGPWQLVPATALHLGLVVNSHRDQRRDWVAATRAACRYLRELKRETGSGLLAIAAFNCGPGRVRREVSRAGTTDFWKLSLPAETRTYVPRALALIVVLETPPTCSRFQGRATEELPGWERVRLPYPVKVSDLATICGVPGGVLRNLNPSWRLDVTPADGHEVTARLPRGSAQEVLAAFRAGKLRKAKPPPLHRRYRIRRGDTLWGIARHFHTTVRALRRMNKLGTRSLLRPGRMLDVPDRP